MNGLILGFSLDFGFWIFMTAFLENLFGWPQSFLYFGILASEMTCLRVCMIT